MTVSHPRFEDLFKKEQSSIYDRMIDAENWSRVNFFEQRATEYLKAQIREGWDGPDGVWAPLEEWGDADGAADRRVA